MTNTDSVATGTTIRFFISSTFVDFQTERDVLQRRVFPALRTLCAEAGFRLQPIDLRWGVSEEAGTDRQTLRICFDELERCRALSPDLFLVILLGERYGSYILPPAVPAALTERLLAQVTLDEREHFAAAYRLDENAVPPEFVLLRAEGSERAEDEHLRQALVRAGHAARLWEDDRLLFEGSATHRELQLGLLGESPEGRWEEGVLCAVRTFTGTPVGPAVATYAEQDPERAARARQLSEAILSRLPEGQTLRYQVAWDGVGGPAFDDDEVAAAYLGLLRPKLEAVIAARTSAREAARAEGRDEVALTNARFEAERLEHFVGRKEPLSDIVGYLAAPAASPLVVTGPGGSGKSTLLAKVVEQAGTAHPKALLLVRYVGATPGAASLRALLDGLRADLGTAYGQELEPVQEDYQRAKAFRDALGWATPERPLILLVDALDQLGPAPVPLDWLPEALPPHVHLVVSLLDDANRPEFAALLARQLAPQLVALGEMDAAEGDALLARWLAKAGRALQPGQLAAVLAAFGEEGRPLYLRLAFEEARHWRSFDDPAALLPLDPTIPGLVTTRFLRLERRDAHGPVLTGHTLGLLRAAKNGLAEDELLTLLAHDAAVRRDLHRLAPNSPPIKEQLPLPMALWARLSDNLGSYLSEREVDGAHLLTYYHRQLADVAAGRYLRGARGRLRHRDLARYFEAQPLLEGTQPNLRKLSEQPTQEAGAELTSELRHTLTDVGFLERKIAYQRTAGALDDLGLAQAEDEGLRDLAASLRLGVHVLDRSPDQVENQLRGRLPADVFRQVHDLPERSGPWLHLDSNSLVPVGGPLLRTLEGHTLEVHACAYSPDGRTALSASEDRTLRLWDLASGQMLRVLAGHTHIVYACAFSPDGRTALSASWDQTLRVWELATGHEVARFVADAGLTCCAFSPNGTQVVTGDTIGAVHFLTVVGEVPNVPAVLTARAELGMPSTSAAALESPGGEVAREPQAPGVDAADKAATRQWWPFSRHR